jgi:hypothetical protein
VVLLQGSEGFVSWWINKIPNSYLASLSWSPTRNETQGRWEHLAHFEWGGVTTGRWSLSSNHPLLSLPPQALKRELHTVLDPTVKCYNSVEEVNFAHSSPLTPLLPVDKPKARVVAPSVFTKCCLRQLTITELGRAFDLPSCSAKWFASVDDDLPFLLATPTCILLQFGRQMQSSPRAPPTLEGAADLSTSEDQHHKWLKVVNASHEEKATRSDDAKVPTHIWDNRFWSGKVWAN